MFDKKDEGFVTHFFVLCGYVDKKKLAREIPLFKLYLTIFETLLMMKLLALESMIHHLFIW